jgi:Domain of unknown function (DUF222)
MSAVAVDPIGCEEKVSSLRAAVVAAGARWTAGQRQLVRLVAELDASQEWARDGFPTCSHWVADVLDIEVCTVREWLRIGRKLLGLPAVNAAYDEGRLSYSKLRSLTRIATPENEVELCAIAERVPAGRLAHALASWLQRRETPDETEARQHAARGLWWRVDVDGMRVGYFRLPPLPGAVLAAAVDAAVMRRTPVLNASADASENAARWPTAGQQRADALIELVSGGGAAVATEVVLHVRADGCGFDDGAPLAGSIIERIAPDSFLRALIHDAESRPVNASGRHRHPTFKQRRVVRERDRVCVDCGASEFLQFDHEPDYDQSRRTVVDELKLRCRTCHRARHRGDVPTADPDPHQA